MSLWVQHGYGKSDKITRLATRAGVGGAILSPADETNERLAETVAGCAGDGLEVVIDPQLYVYSIPDGAGRLHEEHGLDFGPLTWALSPDDIAGHVRTVLDLNEALGTGVTVGPGPLQRTFGDVWTPISLQYARATQEAASRPVLATLAVEEAGFASWQEVELWLDQATQLDVDGFYVIVSRGSREYPPRWEPSVLANVLRLIYRLAVLNRYRVVWGYSDIAGVLGTAAGATGVGSGWFYTLRSFSEAKWQPSSGGAQAIPRVLSTGLLSALEAPSEGRQVATSTQAGRALPGETTRVRIAQDPDGWGPKDAWDQHLKGLSDVIAHVEQRGSGTTEAVDYVVQLLQSGLELMSELEEQGVLIDRRHRTNLQSYLAAMGELRSAEGF